MSHKVVNCTIGPLIMSNPAQDQSSQKEVPASSEDSRTDNVTRSSLRWFERICKCGCGVKFELNDYRHPQQKYATPACKQKAYRDRQRVTSSVKKSQKQS